MFYFFITLQMGEMLKLRVGELGRGLFLKCLKVGNQVLGFGGIL